MEQQNTVQPWHINFRDREKLPDVKDIQRTSQYQWVAIIVLVVFVGYLSFILMDAYKWSSKVNKVKSQIAAATPGNQNFLNLDKTFKEDVLISDAVNQIYNPSVDVLRVLATISTKRPLNLVFNTIAMSEKEALVKDEFQRDYTVVLNGFVKGRDDQGLSTMEAFEAALSQDDFFKNVMHDFKVESLERAEEVGMLNFVINIQLKGTRAKG